MGSELVRVCLEETEGTVRVLDNNEFNMQRLKERFGWKKRVRYLLGDVRDLPRVQRAIEDVDVVFHVAALKHVWVGESNPMEILKTNVIGTQNVIDAVLDEYDVQVMVNVSSDKAVSPSNFYGQSKAMGEGLTLNAERVKGDRQTVFTVFRPGNFFDSKGSVIDIWKRQKQNGEAITLTKGGMRRYFIGIGRAAQLCYETACLAEGGDIFIPTMKEYSMTELAELYAGDITFQDPEPGEKLVEELWTAEEATRLEDLGDLLRVKPR